MSWPGLIGGLVSRGRLAARLVRDPRVPLLAKGLLALAGVYLVSPLDIIPDVMPIIGEVDDFAVGLLALQFFLQLCPPDAVAYHRAAIAQGHRFTRMPASGPVIDAEFRRQD